MNHKELIQFREQSKLELRKMKIKKELHEKKIHFEEEKKINELIIKNVNFDDEDIKTKQNELKTLNSFFDYVIFCFDKNNTNALRYAIYRLRLNLIENCNNTDPSEISQKLNFFYFLINLLEEFKKNEDILYEIYWLLLIGFYYISEDKLTEILFNNNFLELTSEILYNTTNFNLISIIFQTIGNGMTSNSSRKLFLASKVYEYLINYITNDTIEKNTNIFTNIIWVLYKIIFIKPKLNSDAYITFSKIFLKILKTIDNSSVTMYCLKSLSNIICYESDSEQKYSKTTSDICENIYKSGIIQLFTKDINEDFNKIENYKILLEDILKLTVNMIYVSDRFSTEFEKIGMTKIVFRIIKEYSICISQESLNNVIISYSLLYVSNITENNSVKFIEYMKDNEIDLIFHILNILKKTSHDKVIIETVLCLFHIVSIPEYETFLILDKKNCIELLIEMIGKVSNNVVLIIVDILLSFIKNGALLERNRAFKYNTYLIKMGKCGLSDKLNEFILNSTVYSDEMIYKMRSLSEQVTEYYKTSLNMDI